jgi:hypothetical protein
VAICLLLVLILRLPRHSFLFPRNDFRMRHFEEARRGNLFVSQFQSSDYFGHTFLVMIDTYFYETKKTNTTLLQ